GLLDQRLSLGDLVGCRPGDVVCFGFEPFGSCRSSKVLLGLLLVLLGERTPLLGLGTSISDRSVGFVAYLRDRFRSELFGPCRLVVGFTLCLFRLLFGCVGA